MGSNANYNRRRRLNPFLVWGTVLSVAAVVIVAILILMPEPGPTPEEIAERWANDNVDWAGEEIAGFILSTLGQEGLDAKILKELGGEWIEDRIHEHLLWSFSSATRNDSGGHVVVATASVDFDVAKPPVNGRVEATVPFKLVIEGSDVVNEQIILTQASANANFADIDVEVSAEKVTEGIKGFLGQ